MIIILYILQWLLIIILLIVTTLLFLWMWTAITAKVPFVTVPNAILGDIHKALMLKEGSIVYDLGCGDGRILFHLSKFFPKARYIGIENSIFPLVLLRFHNWRKRFSNESQIEIVKQDFFKSDLSNATHIVVYLYPNIMDDLLPKFENELKKGTRLVSVTFKFTGKPPMMEIDLNRGKYKLARKLYIYEF